MKMKKISAWDYLWYALYAFAGIGIELILLSFVEPLFFGGITTSQYTVSQKVIHWMLTSFCWGLTAFILVKSAKKHMHFDVMNKRKPQRLHILFGILLVVACITINALDLGNLKVVAEFQEKAGVLFVFQYIYYFFEVMLIFLIVAFGQKFVEVLLHKESVIPWGGIILCCTWGVIHILSKGSLYTGLFIMFFSVIYGVLYIVLRRNAVWSYLAIAMAFML